MQFEDEIDKKVQDFMRTHPTAFQSQLVYATGLTYQQVKEALNRLWVSHDM